MRVGETIATYDVGLALRGKSGKFEITGPTGEIYDVTCKPNRSNSNLEWSSDGTDHAPFLIRKVAEGSSLAEATAASETFEVESQAASPLPFVIERAVAEDEGYTSSAGDFGLLYLEDDPATGRASACVYLKNDLRDQESAAGIPVTCRCATFNELDSEIRRLQAQLDEIRSRGKKMFYRAQAVAASA
jgi:hypothetical protein